MCKGVRLSGINNQNDTETTGLVMAHIDALSIDIISFYEGDEYEKREVTVHLNGKSMDVLTFAWVKENE